MATVQLAGAEVLAIDGEAPFAAVDASARQTGRMQAFGTRQNMYELLGSTSLPGMMLNACLLGSSQAMAAPRPAGCTTSGTLPRRHSL